MPRRLPVPNADDTFLWRICKALDEPPRVLAANIGVPYSELKPLLAPRHELAEMDRDEVWWRLSEYVNQRLGLMMAIRSELNKALQRDRANRAVRIAAAAAHGKRERNHGRSTRRHPNV